MLDQIQKCFRCGQLRSLWPTCSQNLARLCNIYLIRLSRPVWFCSFKEGLDHIVQNQPESNLDGLIRFRPNRSGLEAIWCARIISLASGQCFQASLDQMRMGCGVFAGMLEPKVWSGLSSHSYPGMCQQSIFYSTVCRLQFQHLCTHRTCQEFQNTLNF